MPSASFRGISAAIGASGLMPLAFVATGLLFAWIGIRNVRASDAFRRDALQADAEITDVRWELVGVRLRVPGLDRVALTAAVGSHAPLHQSPLA